MRLRLTAAVSDRAYRLLRAAADELGLTVNRHVSLCLEAAAKLSVLDHMTSAMPPSGSVPVIGGLNVLELSLDAQDNLTLANWARSKGMSFEDMIYMILDRAVWDYQPSTAAERVTIRPAVKQREPFDPTRYAHTAANSARLDAELSRRSIAAAERRVPVKRGMP